MTVSIRATSDAAYEGGSASFSVITTGFAPGTQFTYKVVGVEAARVEGTASGAFSIDGTGQSTIAVKFAANQTTDSVTRAGIEITGVVAPDAAQLDASITAFMAKYSIPGLSLSVMSGERLVYAKGYGFADTATQDPVSPDSLFRLASVSKPLTSAVIMDLVEQGRLSLDQKALPLLDVDYGALDARAGDITVRNLLEMTGGWDRDISGDIVFQYTQIRSKLGVTGAITRDNIIEHGLVHTALDFTPGSRYAYSNFGYLILGEIIEKITGKSYEQATQELLENAGINDIRIGGTSLQERAPREVTYYQYIPGTGVPYNSFYMDSIDANGGWIASSVDLMRFVAGMDKGAIRQDFLQPNTIDLLDDKPSYKGKNATDWYSKGWSTNAYGNSWHNGALPGTSTTLVKYASGVSFALLANTNPGSGFYDEVHSVVEPYIRHPSWMNGVDLFSFYDIPVEQRTALFDLADVPKGMNLIDGTVGHDTLSGGASADFIVGRYGNDRVKGGAGSDSIDGGLGRDTAIYAGPFKDYKVQLTGQQPISVVDTVVSRDGTDQLKDIERLQFSDRTMAYDESAGQIYRLYQASFARTPDIAGLSYWVARSDEGLSLRDIAFGFLESAEFKTAYGSINATLNLVEQLYLNVLGRPGEKAGIDYWVNLLSNGTSAIDVVVAISESAENRAKVVGLIEQGVSLDTSYLT